VICGQTRLTRLDSARFIQFQRRDREVFSLGNTVALAKSIALNDRCVRIGGRHNIRDGVDAIRWRIKVSADRVEMPMLRAAAR
jgi:hypothetical protein